MELFGGIVMVAVKVPEFHVHPTPTVYHAPSLTMYVGSTVNVKAAFEPLIAPVAGSKVSPPPPGIFSVTSFPDIEVD